MFKENKNSQLVYRHDGKIRGFIFPLENGRYAYSFGKPSQSQFISFECSSIEAAKSDFLRIINL